MKCAAQGQRVKKGWNQEESVTSHFVASELIGLWSFSTNT